MYNHGDRGSFRSSAHLVPHAIIHAFFNGTSSVDIVQVGPHRETEDRLLRLLIRHATTPECEMLGNKCQVLA